MLVIVAGAATQLSSTRGKSAMKGRWMGRLGALAAFGVLTVVAVRAIRTSGGPLRSVFWRACHEKREITSLAFSPSGARLASGDEAGYCVVWDVASGDTLMAFEAHHWEKVVAVAFLGDDRRLATHNYWEARIWDVESKALLHVLKAGEVWHNEGIDLMTGETVPMRAVMEWVDGMLPTPDGRYLLTDSNSVEVWDTQTGGLVVDIEGRRPRLSPDGTLLAVQRVQGFTCIETSDWTVLGVFAGVFDSFSPDGERLVFHRESPSGWTLQTARLPEALAEVGPEPETLEPLVERQLERWNQLQCSPDGELVLENDGSFRIIDLGTLQTLLEIDATRYLGLSHWKLSADGSFIVTQESHSDLLQVYRTATGALLGEMEAAADAGSFRQLAVSPTGSLIAGGTFWQGTVGVWQVLQD